MNNDLLKKTIEARRGWMRAVSGTQKKEEKLVEWESCCSQLLLEAKTKDDLTTVYDLSPANGPTENEAGIRVDDLAIQLAENEIELRNARNNWRKASEKDKKEALAKMEDVCLRFLDKATTLNELEIVIELADKCGRAVMTKVILKSLELAFKV